MNLFKMFKMSKGTPEQQQQVINELNKKDKLNAQYDDKLKGILLYLEDVIMIVILGFIAYNVWMNNSLLNEVRICAIVGVLLLFVWELFSIYRKIKKHKRDN